MDDIEEKQFEQGLRLEAQAVEFGRLSWSQVEAVDEITRLIHSAYRQPPQGATDLRRNQILMISGEKGSGKTTLALSLRQWYDPNTNFEGQRGDGLKKLGIGEEEIGRYEESGKRIEHRLKECSRVEWLAPLSLDAMPAGTNLVAAIFARITEAAARFTDADSPFRHDRGLLEPVSLFERVLHELGSLRSDAVMALEGNLHRRADGMDPESYSIAAFENEKKKLEVANRLNSVLSRLIERTATRRSQDIEGIFILPVDDIDSSPERAVEMLKLAYSLSIPRLLFLFLGSIETIDQILFYQVQGEFRNLLQAEGQADADALESVTAMANTIASSSLRKMVPPSHRIALESLPLIHARRFKVENKTETLDKLMEKVTFEARVFCTKGPNIDAQLPELKLSQFLLVQDSFLTGEKTPPGDFNSYFYDGLGILKTAPRHLADLYSLFARHAFQTDRRSELVQELFAEEFRPLVDEDGPLTPPVQNALKGCLEVDPHSRDLELTPPMLRMTTETGDHLAFEVTPFKTSSNDLFPSCHIEGRRVRNLELRSVLTGKPRKLSGSTRSSFKLIHDLIRTMGVGVVTETIPHQDRDLLASTTWDDGIHKSFSVPWFCVNWFTFWHTDLFFRIWNRGLQQIRRICRERAEFHADNLGHLSGLVAAAALVTTAATQIPAKGHWICTELAEYLPKLLNPRPRSSGESWDYESIAADKVTEAIAGAALGLAEHVQKKRINGKDDDEADQIDNALINLVLLLAPECGIPDRAQYRASFKSLLSHNYIQEKLALRIRLLRLQRIEKHASTLFGIALLNPFLADEVLDRGKSPGMIPVRNDILSYFGGYVKNNPEFELYCPTKDNLSMVFRRAEMRGWTKKLSDVEVEHLRSKFGRENKST